MCHRKPIFHLIPHINHKSPTSYISHSTKSHTTYMFPLKAPNLLCECDPPTLHFPKPLDHAQLGHFSLPILLVLIINIIVPPNLPPSFQHVLNLHQFISQRLIRHQHSCQTSNSSNPNLCDHPSSIPSLAPTLAASTWTWVSSLDVFRSFHLNLCCP